MVEVGLEGFCGGLLERVLSWSGISFFGFLAYIRGRRVVRDSFCFVRGGLSLVVWLGCRAQGFAGLILSLGIVGGSFRVRPLALACGHETLLWLAACSSMQTSKKRAILCKCASLKVSGTGTKAPTA